MDMEGLSISIIGGPEGEMEQKQYFKEKWLGIFQNNNYMYMHMCIHECPYVYIYIFFPSFVIVLLIQVHSLWFFFFSLKVNENFKLLK